mgnify:CR=1 FL=1
MSGLLFLLFEAVAITLWLIKDNLFYLLNFSYIGTCLALGTALFTAEKRYARHFVQLAVGSYMLLMADELDGGQSPSNPDGVGGACGGAQAGSYSHDCRK